MDSRDYDETGVDIVEALELGKLDIYYLQFMVHCSLDCIPVSAGTDNDDASKDFDEKEISLIDDNRLLSIKENYTEEEGEDVLTEKLVRNIKPAVKTEVRHLSRPVLRKVSTPPFRVRHQLSSSSQRAVLRGSCRARRQLENVSRIKIIEEHS